MTGLLGAHSLFWMRRLAPLLALTLIGCPDDVPDDELDAGADVDYCELVGACDEPDDGPIVEPEPDNGPAPTPEDCKEVFEFQLGTGAGIATHPVVDDAGIASMASGTLFVRANSVGGTHCSKSFAIDGHFGAPSQTNAGDFFVGTSAGMLFSITQACEGA